MIQERENGMFDQIMMTLRYGLDSTELANNFCKELSNNEIVFEMVAPSKFNKWSTVVLIDNLDKINIDPHKIKSLNEQFGFDKEIFDFFFGITSKYQMGGFTIPPNIVEYIRIIGGEVNFSYSIGFE